MKKPSKRKPVSTIKRPPGKPKPESAIAQRTFDEIIDFAPEEEPVTGLTSL